MTKNLTRVKSLTWASYHTRKGVASTWIMAPLTRVLVRTNSLLEALYTFYRIRIDLCATSMLNENTHDTDDAGLACNMFRAPRKVARFKAQCTVFEVSPPDSNGVYAFSTEFSVCGLATEFELSLFAVVSALGTGCRTLMP